MTYTVSNYYQGLSGWLIVPILAFQWSHGLGQAARSRQARQAGRRGRRGRLGLPS